MIVRNGFQAIVILILSSISFSFAQKTYQLNPRDSYRFNWSSVKAENNPVLLKSFIRKNRAEFEFYFLRKDYSPTVDDLINSLYLIDLNGDQQLDVIFDGESGGEPYSIKLFLADGDHYKKVFDDQQGIQEFEFKNGILSKLYIQDWGCCATFITFHYLFTVDFNQMEHPFKLTYTLQSYEKIKWPKNYVAEQTYFTVLNDGYKLRFEPFIDDSTNYSVEFGTLVGNTIGSLPAGTKGYKLAEKNDETGRLWWFVAIEPNDLIQDMVYYTVNHKENDYYLGWVSSRFLEFDN